MAFTTRSLFCIASSSSQLSSESSSRSTCSASSWLWPVRFPQHLGHCYAGRLLLLLFALSILDESSFEREREIIGYVFIGLVLGFFVAICLLIFISRVRQCRKSKKKPKIKAQPVHSERETEQGGRSYASLQPVLEDTNCPLRMSSRCTRNAHSWKNWGSNRLRKRKLVLLRYSDKRRIKTLLLRILIMQ